MSSIDKKNVAPNTVSHEDFKLEIENGHSNTVYPSDSSLSSSSTEPSVPLSDSESPPSLDAYSYSRLKEVRRSIWSGGLTGLMYGLSTGTVGSLIIVKYYPTANFFPFKSLKPKNGSIMNANQLRTFCIKRNNLLLFTTLVFGAMFSFVGATVEGKNKVHFIQDIFSFKTPDSKSNVRENWKDIFSSEKFYSRQKAIEAQKEKRKQDAEELRRRSY